MNDANNPRFTRRAVLKGAVLLATGEEILPEAIMLAFGGDRPTAAVESVALGTAPVKAASATTGALVGRTVAEVERDLILETLHHCFGNRTHAANILGISIRTLRNKLKQYSEDGVSVPMPGAFDRATI